MGVGVAFFNFLKPNFYSKRKDEEEKKGGVSVPKQTIKIKDSMDTFLREYRNELFRYYEHYIKEPEIEEHI